MSFEWKDLAQDFSKRQRAIVGDKLYDQVCTTLSGVGFLGDALEVACGDGGFTAIMAPQSRRLVATDIEETMCSVARQRLASFSHVEVLQADGLDLPFEEASFDSALALNFLHILPPQGRETLLQGFSRVTRQCGRLVVMDFGIDGMTDQHIAEMVHRYEQAFGPVSAKKKPVTFDVLVSEVETACFAVERRIDLLETTGAALIVVARKR